MKTITLCADDYGQNEFISQAIITLLEGQRLSATSCMTNGAAWHRCAEILKPYLGKAAIGLHFNLTEGHLLTLGMEAMPLGHLIQQAYWGDLDDVRIEAELNAQLDAFSVALGQLPDFLDGHQHIHQLPIIRDVIFRVYEKRLRRQNSYIRCVYNEKFIWQLPDFKRIMINLLGAKKFKRELVKRKIPHNTGFSGIYPFQKAARYGRIFPRFLRQSQAGGMVMCHPGYPSEDENDSIAAARAHELQYFLSDKFLEDCQRAKVLLNFTPPC